MRKSYQLAVVIGLLLACLNPEVTSFPRSFVNHGRPNATYVVPAQNYQPGYNHSRSAVQQPNIGFHNYAVPNHAQSGFKPQPYYGTHGVRPANLTAIQGGYRPHNGTNIFGRLFKFW